MVRLTKATIRTALLAGLAAAVVATQLEPTTLPHVNVTPEAKPELRIAIAENTRHLRPDPAALAKPVAFSDTAPASDSHPPTPREPIHVTAKLPSFSKIRADLTPPDQEELSTWVRVNGSVVNVRSGPRASAQRIGSFREGTRLRVIKRSSSWTKVEDPETGQSGWMYHRYLAGMSEGAEPAS